MGLTASVKRFFSRDTQGTDSSTKNDSKSPNEETVKNRTIEEKFTALNNNIHNLLKIINELSTEKEKKGLPILEKAINLIAAITKDKIANTVLVSQHDKAAVQSALFDYLKPYIHIEQIDQIPLLPKFGLSLWSTLAADRFLHHEHHLAEYNLLSELHHIDTRLNRIEKEFVARARTIES